MGRIASGRVSMARPFVREGSGQLTLPLYFVYILYKVQLILQSHYLCQQG